MIVALSFEYALSPITPLSSCEGISNTGTVLMFIPISFRDPAIKFVFKAIAFNASFLSLIKILPKDFADSVLGNSL